MYIIRFEGTITQGPNKGRSYTFRTSWGGVQFTTKEEAYRKLEEYRQLEPELRYMLIERQWVCKGKGKCGHFQETQLP